MSFQIGIAVGPDGSVYVADYGDNRVRRISSPFPDAENNIIASENGSKLYIFRGGRHLRTLNALTSALRYQFAYDSAGRLIGVTDGDGNITSIEWDDTGYPAAIVSPYGQRTTLAVDTNGYLARVTNPAGEFYQLGSTASGLLTRFTNPRSSTTQFQYNDLGRLLREDDAGGGS